MPSKRATGDAASVFREAKKIVEDARRSRQRSPQRGAAGLADPGELFLSGASAWGGGSPAHAFGHDAAALTLGAGWNPRDAAKGLADQPFLTHSLLASVTGQHVREPSAPAANITQSRSPYGGFDVNIPFGGASPTKLHATGPDSGADTGGGGDQPSRWQQLVRRVNSDTATGPAALSPHSPSKLAARGQHGPSAPTGLQSGGVPPGLMGPSTGGVTWLHADRAHPLQHGGNPGPGMGAPPLLGGLSLAESGAAARLFSDQHDKAARLSPQHRATGLQRTTEAGLSAHTDLVLQGGAGGGSGSGNKDVSPYERAVAALQQAEQQLRGQHPTRRGGTGSGTSAAGPAVGGAAGGAASPASTTLAAAERYLVSAGTAGAPGGSFLSCHSGRPPATGAWLQEEGSFEDVAMGMMRRLASAVNLGLPTPPPQSYAALEPPPAQHVAAAAALAAASAAAAKRTGGAAEGAPAGRAARGAAAAGGADAAPGLELQIAMQGLMSAARQATSEEALRAEQERRRREAAEAAEAEAAVAEERAARLARVVLYLRLWRLAAAWGRWEVATIRADLVASKLRRVLAAWGAAARSHRAERLAGEALELAGEARREQVACQFRRLWLLHRGLGMWRVAAVESAKERRLEAQLAEESAKAQQAEAVRQAAADRFRRLWLLHASLRTWRGAARAGAAARAAAGREAQRRTAVAALLGRLRSQREAFRGPGGGDVGAEADAAITAQEVHGYLHRFGAEYGAAEVQPDPPATRIPRTACGNAAGGPQGPRVHQPPVSTAGGRPFPGLNKWIRPTHTQPRSRAVSSCGGSSGGCSATGPDGGSRATSVSGASGSGGGAVQAGAQAAGPARPGPRGTTPQPFQLATGARARSRRERVLSACDATRHLVGGGPGIATGTEPFVRPEGGAGSVAQMSAAGPSGYEGSAATAVPGHEGWADAADACGYGGGELDPDAMLQAVMAARARSEWERTRGPSGDRAWRGHEQQASDGQRHEAWRDGDVDACWDSPTDSHSDGKERNSVCGGSGPPCKGADLNAEYRVRASVSVGSSTVAFRRCSLTGSQLCEPIEALRQGPGMPHGQSGCSDTRPAGSSLAYGSRRSTSSFASSSGRPFADTGAEPPSAPCLGDSGHGDTMAEPGTDTSAMAAPHGYTSLEDWPEAEQQLGLNSEDAVTGEASTSGRRSSSGWEEQAAPGRQPRPQPLQHLKEQQLRRQQVRPRSAPRAGRLPPGAWRPPSPPPQPRPQSLAPPLPQGGDRRPSTAAAAARRPAPSRGSSFGFARATPLGADATSATAAPPAFTAADLARLRALEVRKRKQADDAARRLAAELAAHMEQLAAVHWRRALLTWFGVRPWLALVGAARQQHAAAERHREAVLLRSALQALAMGAVRSRMRRVCPVVVAVAVGRMCRRERLARAALGRLAAWSRAASLHRRQLRHRVLLGLMRAASAAWSARADAEDFARRRRLWGCFTGWRRAAEQEASARLLWELQRQHEAEVALGRSTARRVLGAWRRAAAEGAEQRAALQQRSAQWAKVQGWLREVQVARASGASVSATPSAGLEATAAAATKEALSCPPASSRAAVEGGIGLTGLEDDFLAEGGDRKARDGRAAPDDDPLGLGPLEEHLQEFTLGPSGLGNRGAGPSGRPSDPGVGRRGGGLAAGPSAAWGGPALAYGHASSFVPSSAHAAKQPQAAVPPRPSAKPPVLPSRQDRLARYLEGRAGHRGLGPTED